MSDEARTVAPPGETPTDWDLTLIEAPAFLAGWDPQYVPRPPNLRIRVRVFQPEIPDRAPRDTGRQIHKGRKYGDAIALTYNKNVRPPEWRCEMPDGTFKDISSKELLRRRNHAYPVDTPMTRIR